MPFYHKDKAGSKAIGNRLVGEGSIRVVNGEGAKFGSPSPSAPMKISIYQGDVFKGVLLCTGVVGDYLTISGPDVNYTDFAVNNGDDVVGNIVADHFNSIWAAIGSITFPAQSGNEGKFLSTDGSNFVWTAVDLSNYATISDLALKENVINAGTTSQYYRGDKTWQSLSTAVIGSLPSQTSQSGKFLTTNGTTLSWGSVDLSNYATVAALAGKADITALNSKENSIAAGTASQYYRGDKTWQDFSTSVISSLPSQTGQSGKVLTTNGSTLSWGETDLSLYATISFVNNQLSEKEPVISSGSTSQYIRGDKSLATFSNSVIAALPAQTSNAGKFLTTDGTNLSWGVVDLTTKENVINIGTTSQYWRGDKTWQDLSTAVLNALPSFSGNDGKYLSLSSGALTWSTVAGGGGELSIGDVITGGSTNRVLFITSGAVLSQDSGFTYDSTTQQLTVASKIDCGERVTVTSTTTPSASSGASLMLTSDAGTANPQINNSRLAYMLVNGQCGNGTVATCGITAFATENWTTSANGSEFRFETTANGTTTRNQRLRIAHDGEIAINSSSVANANANLLTIKGSASHTGDMVSVRNSSNSKLLSIDPSGKLAIGNHTPAAGMDIGGGQGLNIRNNVGSVASSFDSNGYGFVDRLTFSLANYVDLAVGTNLTSGGHIVAYAGTIAKIKVQANVNGSSGGFTLTLKNNGSTVATMVVANNATTVHNFTPTTPSIAENDLLTIGCTSTGSGVQSILVQVISKVGNN